VTARRRRNQGRLSKLHELRAQRAAMLGSAGSAKLALAKDDVRSKTVIEADHVSKSFGEREIIRDFTLRIQRGDRIGLVGPNGVGNGHADGERTQPQASTGSVDNGHSQGEHVNGSQVEAAAAAEESAAPRRGRRPRRKATAAALEPEAAGAVEGPSGESGGAMEQAE